MKKKLIFTAIVLSIVLLPFAVRGNSRALATAAAAVAKVPFRYGVWLPYWTSQDGAQNISQNLDRLDEISPFSYEIGANGALVDSLRIGNGSWTSWFLAVHQLGLKIIPTIAWFDGNGIYNLLSNTKTRQAEEDRIAALVKTQKFDGIDIDFESMTEATQPYYSLFIQGLAIRLHPQGKLLTCTVIARTPPEELYHTIPDDIVYSQDYSVLNKYCDEVRVMAYDQDTIDLTLNATKGNGHLYAPVADPAWVESVLKETLKYVNPKKVMLGIPTYGYEYQVSWNSGIMTYERVRSFDYSQAMDRADSLGIQPMRNNAGEMSFTFTSSTHIQVSPILVTDVLSPNVPPELATPPPTNATTTFFVSFPDAQSILGNINVAKKYGLRGAMLFKADGDIDPMTWQYMK
jgi:spore germination protein YaaH